MAITTIGNMVAQWDDDEPLIFTLSEEIGSKGDLRVKTYEFDLSDLQVGFEAEFLVNLIYHCRERRHRVSLITVKTELENFQTLFRKVIAHKLFDTKISIIDELFLLALNTISEKLSFICLETLKRNFNFYPYSPIFAHGLRSDNFPEKSIIKGNYGILIHRILNKILTRAACIEILRCCEEAYEDEVIDIGLFSFINLAFSVYARPDSYRRIRISDLVHDTNADAFFLYIPPAKQGVNEPQKICYRINKHLGMLLLKQRQQVIDKFGDLIDKDDIGKLALFPARKIKRDKSGWVAKHANNFFGETSSAARFNGSYFSQIQMKVLNSEFCVTANALRHTVGTQLAEAGCSAITIQAVLKHAGDQTCMAYVDIAFNGLINDLSDAMQPAFETHLPAFERFRSKDQLITPNKAVYSEDLVTGRIELTGECGKEIRCQAAPFTCYVCNKFIPCFDADHSLNMDVIQSEIDIYKGAGTPYKHLVEKAKSIKYRIQLVIAACDLHQQAVAEESWRHE